MSEVDVTMTRPTAPEAAVSATQQRLPLTPRQAAALAKWLPFLIDGLAVTSEDERIALREVARKLENLREK